jgi:xylulokinase
MSLLGIDIGTAGCKAAAFSEGGKPLSLAYEEYDIRRPAPGRAELEVGEVWRKICRVVRAAAAGDGRDSARAVSVSSFGEAVVPVGADRRVLDASILNFDMRGEEYIPFLGEKTGAEDLYRINGNILANWYTLPKLLWLRDHEPSLYDNTALFLHWGSFVACKLGAEPAIDYSLANRTLLFDLDAASWSQTLAERAGVDIRKLPPAAQTGYLRGPAPRDSRGGRQPYCHSAVRSHGAS